MAANGEATARQHLQKFSAPHSSSQLPARVITRDALICVILFWGDFRFPAVTEIHGIFKSA
jgi:hypothetical protein